MSTISQGAIRPFSDRIESALILSEAASATLEKNPTDEAIETAAHTLIRAGVGLLSIANEVYLIDGREQAELQAALVNGREALSMALAGDLGDGPGAVVILVRDLMDQWAERLDSVNMTHVDLEDRGHE